MKRRPLTPAEEQAYEELAAAAAKLREAMRQGDEEYRKQQDKRSHNREGQPCS
jgi:hypothetical protein